MLFTYYMKNTFIIILIFTGFVALGQENSLQRIDNEIKRIESDSALEKKEFDWAELSGTEIDGDRTLRVWRYEKMIYKIVLVIGLSNGRNNTTIYLNEGNPIKIIETEENFGSKNDELNNEELKEVYREVIYVLDWKNDSTEIKRIGKRIMSEPSCSMYELVEPVIARAEKAAME